MCLYYSTQTPVVVIGSKSGTTRTAVALTDAYAANTKTFEVGGYSKLNLSVLYTMGSAETSNSIDIQIEESPDGTNFYRIPNDNTVAGTSTLTARTFSFVGTNAAAATIGVGIDIFYKYLKVSAKETGVASNYGTVYIEGLLSGK